MVYGGVVVLIVVHECLYCGVYGVLIVCLGVLGLGGLRHLERLVYGCGEAQQLYAADALLQQGGGLLCGRVFLHEVCNPGDGVAPLAIAGIVGLDPGLELFLLLPFTADDFQCLEGFLLADPLLPAVGGAGVFACVLETYGLVCAHGLP